MIISLLNYFHSKLIHCYQTLTWGKRCHCSKRQTNAYIISRWSTLMKNIEKPWRVLSTPIFPCLIKVFGEAIKTTDQHKKYREIKKTSYDLKAKVLRWREIQFHCFKTFLRGFFIYKDNQDKKALKLWRWQFFQTVDLTIFFSIFW